MRFLRDNPSVPRKDISSKLAPVLANLDPDETIDADAALDLAARITFMVSCRRTKKGLYIATHPPAHLEQGAIIGGVQDQRASVRHCKGMGSSREISTSEYSYPQCLLSPKTCQCQNQVDEQLVRPPLP
jgi:hypothetical protein